MREGYQKEFMFFINKPFGPSTSLEEGIQGHTSRSSVAHSTEQVMRRSLDHVISGLKKLNKTKQMVNLKLMYNTSETTLQIDDLPIHQSYQQYFWFAVLTTNGILHLELICLLFSHHVLHPYLDDILIVSKSRLISVLISTNLELDQLRELPVPECFFFWISFINKKNPHFSETKILLQQNLHDYPGAVSMLSSGLSYIQDFFTS